MSPTIPIVHDCSSSVSGESVPTAAPSGRDSTHRRRQHHWSGWCAIIGSVALALFWGIFSLDEPLFSIGFVMHNIPSMVILVGGALGWRWPWVGAAWLGAAAVLSLKFFIGGQALQYLPLVTLPPAVLAGLFSLDALKNPRGM